MEKGNDLIKEFIEQINLEIKKKLDNGEIKKNFFITTKCNKNTGSEPHAKILGLISKIFIKKGFDVEIERALYNPKRFVPDLMITSGEERIAVVEYETTNSSDSRIHGKRPEHKTCDIQNFEDFIKIEKDPSNKPKYWIVITTLPKEKVDRPTWEEWKMSRKSEEFAEIICNPFEYYYLKYISRLNKIEGKIFQDTKLVFLNIDRGEVSQIWPK